MNLIEKTVGKMDFHYDLYPFDTSIVPIYTFLPLWAQKGSLDDMLSSLKSSATGPGNERAPHLQKRGVDHRQCSGQ